MERTKLLTFAVIGLFLLNILTIAFLVLKPERSSHPGPPRNQEPSQVIIERLHFDEPQQKQYRTLIQLHQEQVKRLNEQSIQLYRSYYSLLTADRPDTVQAMALSQQIGATQRRLAEVNFAHFNQIKALCHPDQQANFVQLVDELSQLFGRQQRPPRPDGDGPPPGRHPDGPPENFPPRQ